MPKSDNIEAAGLGLLGMRLLLASLSVLFVAGLLIYLLIRARADTWPPTGWPGTPPLLWANTAVLILGSATIHLAKKAADRADAGKVRAALLATLALGLLFIAGQGVVWAGLIAGGAVANKNLFAFAFYFLSGLHAAHVVGGIIFLAITAAKAFGRAGVAPVTAGYCAMYWHFLDAAWLVLFSALFLF